MNSLIKRVSQLTFLRKSNAYHSEAFPNAHYVEKKCMQVINRNPRNLELMRIARKPAGYHLEAPGHEYWHKLIVTKTSRHVTAEIIHFENKTVLTASTREWSIKKHLFRLQDRAAYLNLGRVMAQRCLESGIVNVRCDLKTNECEKLQLFLTEMVKGGIMLEEPTRYVKPAPWDRYRPQKPWEVED